MKNFCYITLMCCILCSLISCSLGNKDPFAKCRGGKPQAVFAGSYETVNAQHFEIKGMEGVEQVSFSNGMEMELVQAGCEKIKQIFHFNLPGQFNEDENWILLTASQFQFLSGVSEKHFELGMWGQAIQQSAESLFLGERIMLQPGYFIKIDKIKGTDSVTLIVELSEE